MQFTEKNLFRLQRYFDISIKRIEERRNELSPDRRSHDSVLSRLYLRADKHAKLYSQMSEELLQRPIEIEKILRKLSNYCQSCKRYGIPLHVNSTSVTADGKEKKYYMCRECTRERVKRYRQSTKYGGVS